MHHTFLLEEGTWLASGILWDENEREVPLAGHAYIEHSEDAWLNRSSMRLLSEPTVELKNDYEIAPIPENASSTVWTSFNQSFGKMVGTFAIIGDSILSTYRSESGEYAGSEYFLKEDEDTYLVKGVLFKGTVKISSWEAMLTREQLEEGSEESQ